jgi:SAM-dependent methyltransferase
LRPNGDLGNRINIDNAVKDRMVRKYIPKGYRIIRKPDLAEKFIRLMRANYRVRMVERLVRAREGYRTCNCCICGAARLHAVRLGGEKLVCIQCGSNGRQRAVVSTLNDRFPGWEQMLIHESSPSGASFQMFTDVCTNYFPTFYWPDVSRGASKGGFRCEDLQEQTFEDSTFDLVLTQDVFEHILNPDQAFREVVRTLKPGGAHLFTVPTGGRDRSITRARYIGGKIVNLLDPQYHGNPTDPNGSLVVTDWGADILDVIKNATGLDTCLLRIRNEGEGIEGRHPDDTHAELFITYKPAT